MLKKLKDLLCRVGILEKDRYMYEYGLTYVGFSLSAILVVSIVCSAVYFGYMGLNNFQRTKEVEAFSMEATFTIAAAEEACGVRPNPRVIENGGWTKYWDEHRWVEVQEEGKIVFYETYSAYVTVEGYEINATIASGPDGPTIQSESLTPGEVAQAYLKEAQHQLPSLNYIVVSDHGGPNPEFLNSPATVTCRRDAEFDWSFWNQ